MFPKCKLLEYLNRKEKEDTKMYRCTSVEPVIIERKKRNKGRDLRQIKILKSGMYTAISITMSTQFRSSSFRRL